jgi:hypothetical protein
MAWERRRNGRLYFYRARRIGGRVVKRYVGAGKAGEMAARMDAERRAERSEEMQWRQQFDLASRMLATLGEECDDLARSALAEAGLYQHHREWRRYGNRRNKKA